MVDGGGDGRHSEGRARGRPHCPTQARGPPGYLPDAENSCGAFLALTHGHRRGPGTRWRLWCRRTLAGCSVVQQVLKSHAEHKVSVIPCRIPFQELQALEGAYELRYYHHKSQDAPSKSYLGAEQERIEVGVLHAESSDCLPPRGRRQQRHLARQ